MTELPKAYTPRDVEGSIYERWLAAGVFAPLAAGPAALAVPLLLRHHPSEVEHDWAVA